MPTIGRNDPCPCGSGKKYKRCCLARAAAEERESASHQSAAARALAWLDDHHGAAVAAATDADLGSYAHLSPDQQARVAHLREMMLLNSSEWLLAEGEIEVGCEPRRALDLVLGPGGPLLEAGEREWLEALAREPLVLLEIQEAEPGRGLWVKNVFDPGGERLWVVERSASRQLRTWDLLGARLIPWQDHWKLSGCVYPFDRSDLPALRSAIAPMLRSPATKKSTAAAARMAGWVLRQLWLQLTLEPPRGLDNIQIVDTGSGAPILLVTDHYRIVDRERLAQALAAQPDVEDDGRGGWVRFEELGDEVRRSLVSLEVVGGDRLKAFARTQRRADTGRTWLADVVGGSLELLRREISDPKALMAQGRGQPRRTPAAPPIPMTTEVAQAVYDHVYRAWASDPLPVLGGKTPRQAVRSKAGRQQVIDLLKTYEQGELRRAREESREPASLQFLWDGVGLDRESILG
jgi:hypothetical protein